MQQWEVCAAEGTYDKCRWHAPKQTCNADMLVGTIQAWLAARTHGVTQHYCVEMLWHTLNEQYPIVAATMWLSIPLPPPSLVMAFGLLHVPIHTLYILCLVQHLMEASHWLPNTSVMIIMK